VSASFEHRGGSVWAVAGDANLATAPALLAASERLWREAPARAVLDLQALQRIDSAALALLLEWLRRAAGAGVVLQLRNVPPRLQAIARLCDVDEVLARHDAGEELRE